jgi:hypothetical protein
MSCNKVSTDLIGMLTSEKALVNKVLSDHTMEPIWRCGKTITILDRLPNLSRSYHSIAATAAPNNPSKAIAPTPLCPAPLCTIEETAELRLLSIDPPLVVVVGASVMVLEPAPELVAATDFGR